jgi:hypothetical protein
MRGLFTIGNAARKTDLLTFGHILTEAVKLWLGLALRPE